MAQGVAFFTLLYVFPIQNIMQIIPFILLCIGAIISTMGATQGDDTRHSLNPEVQGILNIRNTKK